jgi:adenine-specific DNA-methyltransferase
LFKLVEENEVIFEKRENGTYVVYEKLRGNKSNYKQFITILKDQYLNANATEEIKSLFNVERSIFDFPKPVNLIKDLILLAGVETDEIVLDFFAGSGSTAHATMQINNEDGESRKFICIQIPELTEVKSEAHIAGYKTISEITKERINRAGEKIKSELKDDLFSEEGKTLDVGFRSFKLDSSNIRAWDGNPDALVDNLFNAGSNIKENRTEEDVLYEILLKYGLDLTMPIEQKQIAGKQVFNIGMGALFICLGDNITTAVAEGIGKWKEEQQPATSKVIFKDTGFTDVEKTNSMQILKRFGIHEVNTI